MLWMGPGFGDWTAGLGRTLNHQSLNFHNSICFMCLLHISPDLQQRGRVRHLEIGTGSCVLLRPGLQSARITIVTALAAARETSPVRAVSKYVRADIGCGNARKSTPVASRSRQYRDRTRKKAWVHRSKVEPTSRVARAI